MTILASGLFITVRTHWLSSFVLCCSDTVLATQQTTAVEQSGYCYMCCSTYCSRDTLSESSYKQREWKEIIFLPCQRRELSMSKFSLCVTYSTCKNTKRKPQQQQKINVYQLHNKQQCNTLTTTTEWSLWLKCVQHHHKLVKHSPWHMQWTGDHSIFNAHNNYAYSVVFDSKFLNRI